ncbi:hypothetical protein ASNO1_69450 [Corallococcus caeni]|uniref:Uncharacterized protein n=1 Tax=Corallococcus caeni TaxID=3082388 RepID=A0ABQ6R391_9BACT|nr:hypothetical protein ASNO1_69450 [Corallococcus sp. NO1]
MMTAPAVLEMVRTGAVPGPGFNELRLELRAGTRLEEIGQGRMTSEEARGTFAIRQRTAAKAGVPVEGLAELLSELSAMKREEELVLFHFGTRRHVFTVVIHAPDQKLVGCIRAPRQELPGPEQ